MDDAVNLHGGNPFAGFPRFEMRHEADVGLRHFLGIWVRLPTLHRHIHNGRERVERNAITPPGCHTPLVNLRRNRAERQELIDALCQREPALVLLGQRISGAIRDLVPIGRAVVIAHVEPDQDPRSGFRGIKVVSVVEVHEL